MTERNEQMANRWFQRAAWMGIATAAVLWTACGATDVKPGSSESAAKQPKDCENWQEVCAQGYPVQCREICLDGTDKLEAGPEGECPTVCSSTDPDSCREYCPKDSRQSDDGAAPKPTQSDDPPPPADQCEWVEVCAMSFPIQCHWTWSCPADERSDPNPGDSCVISSDGEEHCSEAGGGDGESGTTGAAEQPAK